MSVCYPINKNHYIGMLLPSLPLSLSLLPQRDDLNTKAAKLLEKKLLCVCVCVYGKRCISHKAIVLQCNALFSPVGIATSESNEDDQRGP